MALRGAGGEDQSALVGVWGQGDPSLVAGIEVEDEIVGEGGGEDQRGTLDGESQMRVKEAGDAVGIDGAQGWRESLLYCGEADDDNGFGIVKAGRRVEA